MATLSEALNTAHQHHQAGRLDLAEELYRRVLAAEPENADACNGLGVILRGRGDLAAAADCFQRAVRSRPDLAEAHNSLGNVLRQLGRVAEAAGCYRRAVELLPASAVAHNNLAVACEALGRLDEAASHYRRALELDPHYAEAWSNFAGTLVAQGKPQEALEGYRRALDLNPALAAAHTNLGNLLREQGRMEDAIACHRRALDLAPDFVPALNNLGLALQDLGRLAEAEQAHRRALAIDPRSAEANHNLGRVLLDQGRVDEAIACGRRAVELKPQAVPTLDNVLVALAYHPDTTPASLRQAHAEYQQRHAAPLAGAWQPHANGRDADRRLRLGFVSPDFARHPAGYFLVRTLENLDPTQCEIVCYSDRLAADDLTARFRAAAGAWRESRGLSDDALAAQVREDRIDILFDLAGHTANNRLLVFARKPAPIQITWAGYVGTTGLAAMDYILADPYEIPPGHEVHYGENVLRLPDGYVCYDPPSEAPDVSPLPALERGHPTLGSFNSPAKITPAVLETWAAILRRLPDARLVLRYNGISDPSVADRMAAELARGGVDRGRVEFLGFTDHAALMAEYNRIDLALDPFPYSGGLTTCEALWMGVPVVTCPGQTFASRHTLSHLSNVGFTESIARDRDQYVEIAVRLLADLPRLAEIRARLRPQMAASPLCNGKRFAENLLHLLRGVWREWCERSQAS